MRSFIYQLAKVYILLFTSFYINAQPLARETKNKLAQKLAPFDAQAAPGFSLMVLKDGKSAYC